MANIIQATGMDKQQAIPEPGRAILNVTEKRADYYGLPPVKQSHYRWTIGTALFAVGLSGTAQIVTTMLDLTGDESRAPLVRAGRYTAFAASLAAAALYTKDLGTPTRFFNMLRIFRPTSLMSLGSWSITALGAFNGLSAMGQALKDIGFKKAGARIALLASIPATAIATFVSIYTGTELEETSTPFWAGSSPMLPVLLGASNMGNALSIFDLASRPYTSRSLIKRTGILSSVIGLGELFVLKRIERKWTADAASPLFASRLGLLYRTGAVTLGVLTSIAVRILSIIRSSRSSKLLPAASIVRLISGYFLPAVLIFYGNKSANRPEYYFDFTRPKEKTVPQTLQISYEDQAIVRRSKMKKRALGWAIIIAAVAAAVLIDKKLERPSGQTAAGIDNALGLGKVSCILPEGKETVKS